MDLKEIGTYTRNWIEYGQGYRLLESPCEYGIETPSSISHVVS